MSNHFFKIQTNAAILRRKVRYCVSQHEHHKVEWQSQYPDTESFKKYNPPKEIPEAIQYGKMRLGVYDIPEDFYLPKDANTVLIPNYTQLSSFTHSKAQRDFRYIGEGYFYSEIKPGVSKIFKNYIIGTNGKLSTELIKTQLEQCIPGDIYIQLLVYAPEKAGVFGTRSGHTINKISGKPGILSENQNAVSQMLGSIKSKQIFLKIFLKIEKLQILFV